MTGMPDSDGAAEDTGDSEAEGRSVLLEADEGGSVVKESEGVSVLKGISDCNGISDWNGISDMDGISVEVGAATGATGCACHVTGPQGEMLPGVGVAPPGVVGMEESVGPNVLVTNVWKSKKEGDGVGPPGASSATAGARVGSVGPNVLKNKGDGVGSGVGSCP